MRRDSISQTPNARGAKSSPRAPRPAAGSVGLIIGLVFEIGVVVRAVRTALCACGIVLGGLALMLAGQGLPDLKACGVILLCYTAGAAVAVNMTVQVNVMEILRDKE